jgi:hypothetical protein
MCFRLEIVVELEDYSADVFTGLSAEGTAATKHAGHPFEVRGLVDSNGVVFATELRDRGMGDPNDVRLRGPTTDTCDSGSGDTKLTIPGVTVDTASNAIPLAFFNETPATPVPLADNTALCALISAGSGVRPGTVCSPACRRELTMPSSTVPRIYNQTRYRNCNRTHGRSQYFTGFGNLADTLCVMQRQPRNEACAI